MGDEPIESLDALPPYGIAGRSAEGAEMIEHEVRRAGGVVLRVARARPIAEGGLVRRLVHLAVQDVRDDRLRLGHVAASRPLLVREEERKRHVEITVRRRVMIR